MNHRQIDHVLRCDAEILPSSGFATSVMDAVRHEASAPPPIPFPWKRALPGMLIAGGALIYALIQMLIQIRSAPNGQGAQTMWLSQIEHVIRLASNLQIGWLGLAALLTIAAFGLSTQIGARKI